MAHVLYVYNSSKSDFEWELQIHAAQCNPHSLLASSEWLHSFLRAIEPGRIALCLGWRPLRTERNVRWRGGLRSQPLPRECWFGPFSVLFIQLHGLMAYRCVAKPELPVTTRLRVWWRAIKNPTQGGAFWSEPLSSLGVWQAAVGQLCLLGCIKTSTLKLHVLLAAIGQCHLRFLRNPGPRSVAWRVCASQVWGERCV